MIFSTPPSRSWRPLAFFALLLLASPNPSHAEEFRLGSPIECPPSATCYIQSLVDRDPTEGASDFSCGPLTYDGHKGTDFRTETLAQMRLGVPVVAAATGRVRALRDGVPDTGLEGFKPGQDCGNGVVLDHGDGWSTQYCHLAQGSVQVRKGQAIQSGDQLGLVGLSGRTVFPHLHLTVRRNGVVVDPFDSRSMNEACGREPEETLWRDPPDLRFGGLVDHGFIGERPTLDGVREGLPEIAFENSDEVMIFWARAFGLRSDDKLLLTLVGPDGETLAETERLLDRARAEEFAFIGIRRPEAGWAPGEYRASVSMVRDGETHEDRSSVLALD